MIFGKDDGTEMHFIVFINKMGGCAAKTDQPERKKQPLEEKPKQAEVKSAEKPRMSQADIQKKREAMINNLRQGQAAPPLSQGLKPLPNLAIVP